MNAEMQKYLMVGSETLNDPRLGKESINWEIMGPVYRDEVEALRRRVSELEERVTIAKTKRTRLVKCAVSPKDALTDVQYLMKRRND